MINSKKYIQCALVDTVNFQ